MARGFSRFEAEDKGGEMFLTIRLFFAYSLAAAI